MSLFKEQNNFQRAVHLGFMKSLCDWRSCLGMTVFMEKSTFWFLFETSVANSGFRTVLGVVALVCPVPL